MWYHFHRNNARFMAVAVTVFLVFLLPMNGKLLAQVSYPKGKIILKAGTIVEGKDMQLWPGSVDLMVGGMLMTFELTDVQQIMAKRGLAKRMGNICGGGCFGLALGSILLTGGKIQDEYGNTVEYDVGTLMASAALWTAIFYGGGYLVGMAMDDWQIVYFAPQ